VVAALRSRRLRLVDSETQARVHQAVVRNLADLVRSGNPAAGGSAGPTGAAGSAASAGGLCAALPIGGQLGDGVRYLASRDLTRQRLAELMAVERREHLAINTEQSFGAASARAAAPLARQIVDRGVRVRVLGLPPADGDLHVDTALFDRPLFAYREAQQMPMKLLVVDHAVALFPVDPRDFERGYLEISQPAVVQALVSLFDQHWGLASDPRNRGVADIVLTDRERALIALLAQGHTDASAAAQLRISTRSVTNIMRGMMDRFGVDNRFQLGLALGASRAADPPSPPPVKE
jgi:DNA-binding CsgD family transcriptional regulator